MPGSVIEDAWRSLREATPARIALGRTGASLPTREVLAFSLAHAEARDAVYTEFQSDRLAKDIEALGWPTLRLASAAPDRATYLRRPDLGRRLCAEDRRMLEASQWDASDVSIIVADGLSARAVHLNAVPLLKAFHGYVERAGWRVAPVVIASQARVALGDEVGELLRARLTVLLVGERPGLSASDSLGVYLTYAPRIGRVDAGRNCLSNIRKAGLKPERAAFKLAWLVEHALFLALTGVALKDESDALSGDELPPASSQNILRQAVVTI